MPGSLGSGQVWSDLDKPIVHFGSSRPASQLVDEHGQPLRPAG